VFADTRLLLADLTDVRQKLFTHKHTTRSQPFRLSVSQKQRTVVVLMHAHIDCRARDICSFSLVNAASFAAFVCGCLSLSRIDFAFCAFIIYALRQTKI
jgi:hypothetical protein